MQKGEKFCPNCFGNGSKAQGYEIKTTIKAVTYQEMEIKKSKNKVMIQVVVDI